ncbi:MAG TPA: hypothetical protein VKI44_25895 [Acetobacteraceae bacterium]|nr:hypothetical protein [Acetobacteraceae bacterium]
MRGIHLGAGTTHLRHHCGGRIPSLLQVRLRLGPKGIETLLNPPQLPLHLITRRRGIRDRGLQLVSLLPESLFLLVGLVTPFGRCVELLFRPGDLGLKVSERPGRLDLLIQLVRDVLAGGLGLQEPRRYLVSCIRRRPENIPRDAPANQSDHGNHGDQAGPERRLSVIGHGDAPSWFLVSM